MANAGVVGMAEVVVPNSTMGKTSGLNVEMWSFIWAAAAALVLVFLHLAMLGRG